MHLINAPSLAKMQHLFQNASQVIQNAIGMRVVKIRYDGDCDGITAALILKKSIEAYAQKTGKKAFIRFQQSRGAVYSEKDSEEDAATLPAGSLLILLDHGANEESETALRQSSKLFETMVIDHHPPSSHTAKHFVSPFQVKCEEPSSYNTGLLCFEISKHLMPEIQATLMPLCLYSMQGDTSSFRSKEFYPEAVVVDYLAVKASEPYSLEFYEKTLSDKHFVKELYREEQEKMKNAVEKAVRKAKTRNGKYQVVTCDVSGIAKKNNYPSIGKLHNAVQFLYAEKGPTASLLYTGDRLSFRATHSAAELGFSANKIIEALKLSYGERGFTGGGHNVAASTKFPREYGKEIIKEAIQQVMQNAGVV